MIKDTLRELVRVWRCCCWRALTLAVYEGSLPSFPALRGAFLLLSFIVPRLWCPHTAHARLREVFSYVGFRTAFQHTRIARFALGGYVAALSSALSRERCPSLPDVSLAIVAKLVIEGCRYVHSFFPIYMCTGFFFFLSATHPCVVSVGYRTRLQATTMTRLAALMVWATPAITLASSRESSLRGAQVCTCSRVFSPFF